MTDPTVTVGALVSLSVATTVPSPTPSNAYASGAVNAAYLITEGLAVQAGGTYPLDNCIKRDSSVLTYSPGVETGTDLRVTVAYSGAKIDVLVFNGGAGVHRIYVDGVKVATLRPADFTAAGITAGDLVRVPITFADARRRIIEWSGDSTATLRGFTINSAYPIGRPGNVAPGARTLTVGDSFTERTLTNGGFVRILADALGWGNVWRMGSGSTGYIADGTRVALVDRYVNDIIDNAPDRVIYAMGLNDGAAWDANSATVQASWATVWDAVSAALPDAEFIVVGPWPNNGGTGIESRLIAMDLAMQTAAKSRGYLYVSPIQDGLTFTVSDGVHPDEEGCEKIAMWLGGWLTASV